MAAPLAGADRRRVLLKVTVEVTADRTDVILVREGDAAHDLAAEFCRRHGLQDSLTDPLAQHIAENAAAAGAAAGLGGLGGLGGGRAAGPAPRGGSAQLSAGPPGGGALQAPRSATPPPRSAPRRAGPAAAGAGAGAAGAGTPARAQALWPAAATPRSRDGTPRSATPRAAPAARVARPSRGGVTAGSAPGSARRSLRPAGTPAGTPGGTPAGTPAGAPGGAGADAAVRRFEHLHDDAEQRKLRLQRLRQQVERDSDEQSARASIQVCPGTLRSHAWHRAPRDGAGGAGDRLYRDAAERRARREGLHAQRERQRRLEEQEGATFHPAIDASQRSWRGVGRAMRDPEGIMTRMRLARLRELREDDELDGCTFQPQIDQRSDELMQERLGRLQWVGSLHDALYEDAQRRRERQLDAERAPPPGATFQPDIGDNRHRPPNDDTREDFVNRLAYSKSYSERWLAQQGQQENRPLDGGSASGSTHTADEFRPRTGRGPLVERNRDGLPIGEFLYENGREKLMRQARWEEERDKSQPSTPRITDASRALFEETKRRRYADIFDSVTRGDPQGRLCAETAELDGQEEAVTELLNPIVAYLQDSGDSLSFEAFCAALDYQLEASPEPTSHLFVRRGAARKDELETEAFVPQTDRHSSRLASRVRPRSVPLHEQLYRERDCRETHLRAQREAQEARQLQECTFQPNRRPTRSAAAGGRSRRPSGAPLDDANSATPGRGQPARPARLGAAAAGLAAPLGRRGPPGALIDQLLKPSSGPPTGSLPDSGAATPRQESAEEQSIGYMCREQIVQVEQAVAHCKSLVEMARGGASPAGPA